MNEIARYKIEFANSASKEFRTISRKLQIRITPKINALCNEPYPYSSKKLKGLGDYHRIRIGDYRVIYRVVEEEEGIVKIMKVGHRKDVYRK